MSRCLLVDFEGGLGGRRRPRDGSTGGLALDRLIAVAGPARAGIEPHAALRNSEAEGRREAVAAQAGVDLRRRALALVALLVAELHGDQLELREQRGRSSQHVELGAL